MKPRIKFDGKRYSCSSEGEWVGFGLTVREAYDKWFMMNRAACRYDLAA